MDTISCVSLVNGFVFSSLYDVLMVHVDLGFFGGSIQSFSLSCDLNSEEFVTIIIVLCS
jgi:hypothetical protein